MKRRVSCQKLHNAPDWSCAACGSSPACIDGIRCLAPEQAFAEERFDAESFAVLAAIEEQSFWFRARNRLLAWALTTYFRRARTMLEIGCGTGYVLRGLSDQNPDIAFVGSELGLRALSFARERLDGVPLLQMAARDIPFGTSRLVVARREVVA